MTGTGSAAPAGSRAVKDAFEATAIATPTATATATGSSRANEGSSSGQGIDESGDGGSNSRGGGGGGGVAAGLLRHLAQAFTAKAAGGDGETEGGAAGDSGGIWAGVRCRDATRNAGRGRCCSSTCCRLRVAPEARLFVTHLPASRLSTSFGFHAHQTCLIAYFTLYP